VLFAATDRRLGATFLWCALIVLGWALLSVFFGGSAAHADDRGRDQHPSTKASISRPQAPAANAEAHEPGARAPKAQTPKPQAPKSQVQKLQAPKTTAPATRTSVAAVTQLQTSAATGATTVVKQVAPATSIRPAVAAKADRLALAAKDAVASAERKPHPHADGVRGNGHGAHQTDGHRTLPAHANARAHGRAASVPPATHAALKSAHTQTIAPPAAPAHASATTQAAAPATGDEPAVADEPALTSPPSTPPSAGSSMSGAALSAVLLPYDLEPAASGAIGVLSRAADVPLPTGLASSTDVSPD